MYYDILYGDGEFIFLYDIYLIDYSYIEHK
jgi:hypothetical protein